MPKSKIHSPAVDGFHQRVVLYYNCLLWAFAAAASAAECFFIAALSAAMEKDIHFRVLPLGRRPHGPEAASRAKRAVKSYSRVYASSKVETAI